MEFNGEVKEDAIKLVQSFSDLSAPLSSRCASVHILIKIMKKMPYSEFQKTLLPKASQMCKDYNWEVRKTIAGYLEDLFSVVNGEENQEDVDRYLLDELMDLMDDEEVEVSSQAIHHCKAFGNFSSDEFSKRGIEFLLTVLEKKDNNSEILMSEIGPILDAVKESVFESDSDLAKELR